MGVVTGSPRRTNTRELVLAAAERLFAEHGYDGTSLEEIGRAAGLSRGTPGYLFGSKPRLYAAVLEQILERARLALAPAYAQVRDPGEPVEDALAALIEAHVRLLAGAPELARLIQWEALDEQRRLVQALQARFDALVDLVHELRARLGRPALARADAAALVVDAAALLWLPLAHAEALEPAVGSPLRSEDALARQARELLGFVLARLRA